MDFFTSDEELLSKICELLDNSGCCSRCTLRYIGLKDMYTYRGDTQEMDSLVKKLIDKKLVSVKDDATGDINGDVNKNNTENGSLLEDKVKSEDSKENEIDKGDSNDQIINHCTESTVAQKSSLTSDLHELANPNQSNCESDGLKGGNMEMENQSLEIQASCVVCFGVLKEYTSEAFLHKIHSEVTKKGYVYTSYFCSLILPVCVILREYALMLHLKEKFMIENKYFCKAISMTNRKDLDERALIRILSSWSVYGCKKYTDVATVKDVWKWKNGPVLKQILGAPFDAKIFLDRKSLLLQRVSDDIIFIDESPFEITLTFNYKNSDRECSFLLDSGLDIFRQRKMDRRHKKKANFAVYTRANVAAALEKLSEENFKKNYACPPAKPSCTTVCDLKCQNEAVFIAGRYNKYSRELSQTPWIIEGVRRSESSVEELLCNEINKNFKPKEVKFSSSGREDVDVLMLGDGRPFVLELVNPCRRDFSQTELNEMQRIMNSSTKDIACQDLQIVARDDVDQLKEGEIDKVKQYRALCWTKEPVSDEKLNSLNEIKDLKLLQKTPIRVLHRRPLSTRDKFIHSMLVRRVDQHHFSVDLATQAGTYIKEFVHGDFGRTKPNMSTLLGIDCDILELDVTAVELDWPKKIVNEEKEQPQHT